MLAATADARPGCILCLLLDLAEAAETVTSEADGGGIGDDNNNDSPKRDDFTVVRPLFAASSLLAAAKVPKSLGGGLTTIASYRIVR